MGYAASRGHCLTMEDVCVVVPDLGDLSSFFAVYDGHQGVRCAEFCCKRVVFKMPAALAKVAEGVRTMEASWTNSRQLDGTPMELTLLPTLYLFLSKRATKLSSVSGEWKTLATCLLLKTSTPLLHRMCLPMSQIP